MKSSIIKRNEDNSEMLRYIPAGLRSEFSPRTSGWWEYRFMSLMERTRQFARDYCNQYYWTYGAQISFDFEPSSAEFLRLWDMRRSADDCHLSYPMYLELGFNFRRSVKIAERLASPNKNFAGHVQSRTWKRRFAKLWEERRDREFSRLTSMPQFWLKNDLGLPVQTACRSSVRNLASGGRFVESVAETFAIANRIVPAADIVNTVADAKERANLVSKIRLNVTSGRTIIMQVPPMEDGALLQTCFGAHEASNDNCLACAHQHECSLAANLLAAAH